MGKIVMGTSGVRSGVFDLFPKMRIEKRKSALASVSLCLERFLLLSSRAFFSFVISTERSEWRQTVDPMYLHQNKIFLTKKHSYTTHNICLQ